MAQNQRQRPYPQIALNIRPRSWFRSGGKGRRGRRPLHGFLREPEDPSGTPAPACSPEVCRKGQKCQAQGETFRAATQGRPYERSTKHGRRGASRCARKKLPSAVEADFIEKAPFRVLFSMIQTVGESAVAGCLFFSQLFRGLCNKFQKLVVVHFANQLLSLFSDVSGFCWGLFFYVCFPFKPFY